ncbi:hypothetical protein [Megasphaera sueciensis]|uniref:hypothetical protein n=1 Tax=Megasphaera sueciensis TaxID=349094 RepID=UPI003CFC64C7
MLKGTVTVKKVKMSGNLQEALSHITQNSVYVGIPSDQNERNDKEDEINNAELLFIQENGARAPEVIASMDETMKKGFSYKEAHALYIREHGSLLMRIPPRPVLEPSIEANKDKIGKLIGGAYKSALDGNPQAYEANLNKAGMLAVNCAKAWFEDPQNGWPPNAPSTIKQKGSTKPLIDTGTLRKAITYVIREG